VQKRRIEILLNHQLFQFAFCQVSTFVVTTKLDFSTQFLVRGLYQKDLAVPQGLETVPATGSIGAFPQPK